MDIKCDWIKLALIACVCVSMVTAQPGVPFPGKERSPGDPLEPLCEPDAEVPDDLIRCGSCENRCGTKTNPGDLKYLGPGDTCACDKLCGYHGDCCQDFREFCPKETQQFEEQSGLYPPRHTHGDFKCVSLKYDSIKWTENLMIHTCPDGTECEFTRGLSEDVNTFVPMYDIHRGVHYISGQCAVCNGVTSVEPWGVRLECSPLKDPKEYVSTGLVNSTESLTDISEVGDCDMLYSVAGESRPCAMNVISACKDSCQNEALVSLCESASQDLMLYKEGEFTWSPMNGVYRNPYCALCNAHTDSTTSGLTCGDNSPEHGIQGLRPEVEGSFSLTLVFDFDPRKGLTVGEHPPPECAPGEVYVPDEDACRPIICVSGFVLDVSDCIPESSNITAVVTGTFTFEPTLQMVETLYQSKDDLQNSVEEDLGKTLESFGVVHNGFLVDTEMSYKNNGFKVSNKLMCNCDYSSLFTTAGNNNTDKIDEFEEAIADEVRKDVIKYLLQRNLHLERVNAFVRSQLRNSSTLNTQNMDCTWLVYQPNETQTGNGTITVMPSGKTYPSGMFQILDEVVIVCETELDGPTKETETVDFVLSILTLVCITVSILCLLARIVLQYFIASFKKRPGRIQLQLTIAMLLAFVMLILGPLLSEIPEACTTAGILLAYGFLAAFIWMNIIAMDTWLVFRPSASFSRADDEEKSLLIHIICGWGIPLLLVATPVGMNFADVNGKFMPEFGGSRCWYTQRYAMLLYFGLPIALSILLNIFLYISTSYNLHKAFRNALVASKVEGYHFGIYVRLFILMGITWIFGFISAFTDQIVIDFIFVILTSLQGLFLFISFVCNKRVLSEIKKTAKSETSLTLSDRRTKSTPVPSYDSNSKNESVL